jgi:hypothetical protein
LAQRRFFVRFQWTGKGLEIFQIEAAPITNGEITFSQEGDADRLAEGAEGDMK